ncbi:hypothetical protein HMPREF1210_01151 [Paenisporosarcina sp. HGH0030]|uniref:phage terminase small subunit n=1 Tax=Paenisporosarcina sp. HGH0030 TaxID=1078085 RepID=UPI00034E4A89|nr:phage terminase small subunit [Paenisporosarcina sp. HGH0030]EPD52771.1 hypothetical protein HMPREF1210_01151 [Paenisporosarcina sp. HGH0030]
MARARSPVRDKAFEIYKQSNGKKLLKDIAAELDVSDTQIRKWKNQDKWDEQMKGNVTIAKGNVTKQKRGAPSGNDNAKGNNGNRKAAPPKRNSNALKHGFYARHLPEEFLEIMDEVRQADPIDLIWDQIVIQFTAIIRAQKVMWVSSGDDHLKEESGSSWGEGGGSESHKVSFAYEQYYAYLSVQSRAMAELRNLIKQFDEQAHVHDERRLNLEQMEIGIVRTKAEITKISGDEEEEYEDDGFIEALNGKVEEIWSGDDEQET